VSILNLMRNGLAKFNSEWTLDMQIGFIWMPTMGTFKSSFKMQ
jgi:hypothetical protein